MQPQKTPMMFGCGGSPSRSIWGSIQIRSSCTSPKAVSRSPKWPPNCAPKRPDELPDQDGYPRGPEGQRRPAYPHRHMRGLTERAREEIAAAGRIDELGPPEFALPVHLRD